MQGRTFIELLVYVFTQVLYEGQYFFNRRRLVLRTRFITPAAYALIARQ